METVLLQINNNKAYKLIEDLEALHIVKVLKKSSQLSTQKTLSERFSNSLQLSEEDYNKFQNEIKEGRDEWQRGI